MPSPLPKSPVSSSPDSHSRSRWSRPDVGTCVKACGHRCCRQQLRYISCVASLCCQGIPSWVPHRYRMAANYYFSRDQEECPLWLEDGVDTNQRNLVFQTYMILCPTRTEALTQHSLINRGASVTCEIPQDFRGYGMCSSDNTGGNDG